MLSGLKRLVGSISVKEERDHITIDGIPADVMANDIYRIWRTSRINANMFTRATNNTLVFPSFFAVDILYMLEQMIEFGNRRVSARTLTKIRDLLLKETWLANTLLEHKPRVNLSLIRNLIYTPLGYQQRFFETYDELTQKFSLKGFLLAAAAGAGKTYIALALAEMLSKKRVVIVCPKNATERVWMAEIQKLFRKPQTYWLAQHGNPYKGERFLIFHYESLNQAFAITRSFKADDIMVILDESHNLNEETALRTQLFVKLVRQMGTQDILPMSGTPIKALGSESIPLLQMIDPLFTDDAKVRFKKIFGRDGNRGLDILKERLGLLSYKVEKSELGLDKPIMKPLPVTIPNGSDFTLMAIKKDMVAFIEQRYAYYKEHAKEHKALYDACMETHEASLKTPVQRQALGQYRRYVTLIQRYKGDARQVGEEIKWANSYEKNSILPTLSRDDAKVFKDVKSIIKYVNLKIQGEALGRVLGRKRQECHVAMVAHIDFKGVIESTQKKTVVFTSFVPALERAHEHLGTIGFKPLIVYGKTNSDLNRLVQQFEKDEDLNPMCATYQSLSTAVPLIMADTMIMIDSPFRSYIHEQAVSRIHRLGATTQTRVWECRLDTGTEPNISTRSADILEWSQQQVSAIMGIESPFVIENVKDGVTIGNEDYGLDESYHVGTLQEDIVSPSLAASLMW